MTQSLADLRAAMESALRKRRLPIAPTVCLRRGGFASLPRYLNKVRGYDETSFEVIAASILNLCREAEAEANKERVAQIGYEIGVLVQSNNSKLRDAVRAYQRAKKGRGGDTWHTIADRLKRQYPHLSKQQMWRRIPTGEQSEDDEGYIRRDDGGGYLVGPADSDGKRRELKKTSFFRDYLKKSGG